MSHAAPAQQPQTLCRADSPDHPAPSLNLLADSIFANGLGADPIGLVTPDDDYDAIEDLLPLRQRMSDIMVAAHESVDQQVGTSLAGLTLAELQALRTQITLREKQLLTTNSVDELFDPIDPATFRTEETESTSATEPAPQPVAESRLTLLEYAQIREEYTNLANVVCTRTTADLVQLLRQPARQLEVPGARRGKTPLTSAITYVAGALKLTGATVDRRVTAAAAMWPAMQYRRTKLKTPHLATHLARGQISFATATTAQDKLSDMRQAVRRAGGSDATADELVAHKEKEFLRHAIRNNPYTFARLAKQHSDAVTNELVGPRQTLTDEQVKHEKGIFYRQPIGDRLHELCVVVDDAEYLQLKAIREFGTRLDSEVATLRAKAHQATRTPEDQVAHDVTTESEDSADEVPSNSRITSEDIDLGIAKLFDGQTRAERWLNTLMDFASAALILHKTYDPHTAPEDQQRRDEALGKAAEHSEVIADILAIDQPDENSGASKPYQSHPANDPLSPLIPPGYQLLRPNLDLIVQISLRDLMGLSPPHRSPKSPASDSEIAKVLKYLNQDGGITAPVGSPGHANIDAGLARRQACDQRIIPMVLGTASQPLDVGRAQRSFSYAMRRAMHIRDRGCIVPGCTKPAEWCQPHHLDEWGEGGPTSLANGVLLCRHHHAAVHKRLLMVHMEDDGLPSCSLPKSLDPTQGRYRNYYWRC